MNPPALSLTADPAPPRYCRAGCPHCQTGHLILLRRLSPGRPHGTRPLPCCRPAYPRAPSAPPPFCCGILGPRPAPPRNQRKSPDGSKVASQSTGNSERPSCRRCPSTRRLPHPAASAATRSGRNLHNPAHYLAEGTRSDASRQPSLRARGGAQTLIGLAAASDGEIAARTKGTAAALLTRELDFANIRQYPPEDYVRLIVLRTPDDVRRAQFAWRLNDLLGECLSHCAQGLRRDRSG
jgi:hypothetical protein